MNIQYRLDVPDEVSATLKITATVEQWKELKKQLTDSYPSWKLSSAITDLIIKAEKSFNEQVEEN